MNSCLFMRKSIPKSVCKIARQTHMFCAFHAFAVFLTPFSLNEAKIMSVEYAHEFS